jgi:hypothetical protein
MGHCVEAMAFAQASLTRHIIHLSHLKCGDVSGEASGSSVVGARFSASISSARRARPQPVTANSGGVVLGSPPRTSPVAGRTENDDDPPTTLFLSSPVAAHTQLAGGGGGVRRGE